MKKSSFIILALGIFVAASLCQEIIENKTATLRQKAGRIVTLKEEMRIEDTGQGYYFKSPYSIKIASNGDLLIRDGQEQALLFDARGVFMKNIFKKGQGPGELTGVIDAAISPERIFLAGFPPKVLVFKRDGSYEKELPLKNISGLVDFVWADGDRVVIRTEDRLDPAKGGGLIEIPQRIVQISLDGDSTKTLGSFPIQGFVQFSQGGGYGRTSWNQLQVATWSDNKYFVNSTSEYLIEAFVPDKGAVVARFRRPYARVKRPGGGGITGGTILVSGSAMSAPSTPEFKPDIFGLYFVDGKLWVQTSTVVESKGILFDVFDLEGRYMEYFYLRTPAADSSGKPLNLMLTIANGSAYFSDKKEDETIVIKKCSFVGY